jgi:acetylornithine/succinyldiaminopimelate/putrescine aminotransferase/predicted amino acid dehydrogenase
MTPLQLLHELWSRGVELEGNNGELRYSAPKGQITPEVLAELKRHKGSILALLEERANGSRPAPSPAQSQRPSKKFGIAIERPATSPLVPEDWRHPHPYFRYVEPYKGFLLSRLGLDKRFVRGEGVWLFDEEGHRILDGIAQYGALPFGYNPPEIWQALQAIQDRSEPSFAANSQLDAAGELAERLIGLWPEAQFENVVFGNSGAEAVEVAIKLCRAATGRQRLLSTRGAFHGLTLGALAATGSGLYHEAFGPPTGDVDHLPYGDAEALEKMLLSRHGGYAAFLVEPIQGESGIVEPPAGYLARARRLCDQTGTLLVIDEVQTGLGRTGELFASQAEGVMPDVMVLAKALGGGLMPIGACLYTSKARSLRFGLRHSSTFAANTLACRAGLAALYCLEKDGRALISTVKDNGTFLKSQLEELQRRFPALIAGISGRGYMLGIRLDFSNLWRIPGLLGYMGGQNLAIHLIVSYLLNVERVRLSPSFSSGSVLRLEPPLIATREHCQILLASLDRVFQIVDSGDAAQLLAHLLGGIAKPAAQPPRTSAVRRPPPEPRQLASGVSRFAFTVHLMSIGDLTDLDPALEQFDLVQLEELKKQMADYIDPVPVGVIELESKCGARAYGELILVPYTAAELVQMDPEKAHDEVRLAVQVAQERGAQVVGLGGFTSIVTRGGLALDAQGLPPLTSGNAYTAVAAKGAVLRACEDRGLRLEGATLGIVGAAGMIGRATALLLADRVERLILVGNAHYPERTRTRLREVGVAIIGRLWQLRQRGGAFARGSLAARLLSTDPPRRPAADPDFSAWFDLAERAGDISITHDAEADLPRADVVLAASSSVRAFIGARHLKRNAIVCDVARPFNVDPAIAAVRPDVTLIEGGLVRVGGRMEGGIHAGPRPDVVYACVAETMLWALEKAFDRVRPDSSMSMETIDELESYGRKHGFEIETGAPV